MLKNVLVFFSFLVSLQNSLSQDTRRTGLDFDIVNYKVEARIFPEQNRLDVQADVSILPLSDTRTVIFELNGALKIENVTKLIDLQPSPTPQRGRPTLTPTPPNKITFIQDQVGVSELGPKVTIDLGEIVTKNTSVTLRFKYSGILVTPQGGPLLTKRLAFIGDRYGYLTYASRWLPFHDYAADRATADITVYLPKGYNAVAYSDSSSAEQGKYRFIYTNPNFIGNIVYSNYFLTTKLDQEGYEFLFYTKPGTEKAVKSFSDIISKSFDFYTKQFGLPDCGSKLIIAQTDDETLDFYTGQGIILISDKFFDETNAVTAERLPREVAYQWWGYTVGLKSFDDAWLSQGLAEFSAIKFREIGASEAKLEQIRRELLEKALTFEQVASLTRAPAILDDTSTAYQYIMFGKGALVFKLLEETLGKEKFNLLLRTYLQNYRGKNVSIAEFEDLTSKIADEPMRYFFARWVESTGVPEFSVDYVILRTRDKKFITRGTVRQNYSNLRLPVDIQLVTEADTSTLIKTVMIEDVSADFQIESETKPLQVVVDPKFKLLRTSDELKVSAIARRGIELFKEGNLAEAQQQFEAALKLDRGNTWIYYNLGLLYLEQRNYDLAIDNFKIVTQADRERVRPAWIYVWSFIKLGNAYDAKGDRIRATDAYKKALDVGDNYDNAQEVAKRFLAEPFDPRKNQLGSN
ncbi:MAG: M1 family aminopeptidase [Pyrinomonadaceae bacterium]|nr:M1 family aminopeptidase [Pyrinomonadaceae bacterium]MCX7640391.1 M1 family aminopeptidase [Pyrinomonadaceae bacterium]MDW8304819.1 M1 family aminopeptidase [Acidobacteriota bacterium]